MCIRDSPYILLGAPVVTAVSKMRMVLSSVTAVWGLGLPNPDTVYILEIVDQDETGYGGNVLFLAVCYAAHSGKFRRVSSKAIRKLSRVVALFSSVSAVLPS